VIKIAGYRFLRWPRSAAPFGPAPQPQLEAWPTQTRPAEVRPRPIELICIAPIIASGPSPHPVHPHPIHHRIRFITASAPLTFQSSSRWTRLVITPSIHLFPTGFKKLLKNQRLFTLFTFRIASGKSE
jgi:hypothetical protein